MNRRRVIPFSLGGALIAWVIVTGVVFYIFVSTLFASHSAKELADDSLRFGLISKMGVFQYRTNQATGTTTLTQLDALAKSPLLKLRAAIMAAELSDKENALKRLRELRNLPTTRPTADALPGVKAAQESGVPPVAPLSPATPATKPAEEQDALNIDQDAAALIAIYENPAAPVDPATRDRLLAHHGWYAEGALSHEKPSNPLRQAFEKAAGELAVLLIVALVIGAGTLFLGFVLLTLAIVMVCLGKMKPAFDVALSRLAWEGVPAELPQGATMVGAPVSGPPPIAYVPSTLQNPIGTVGPLTGPLVPDAGTYIETFALYLVMLFGSSVVLSVFGKIRPTVAYVVLFVLFGAVACWPLLRGVSVRAWRLTTGLHTGRGVFFEAGAGVVGYIGGLPVIGIGMMITIFLTTITGTDASHPIVGADKEGLSNALKLYFLASVFAPITEELMFRGMLMGNLRGKLGLFISAAISGVIFAAIHPQGWAAIPALASIGFVLALIRQWRGSLIPSIVAHALHNGMLVTMLIYMSA